MRTNIGMNPRAASSMNMASLIGWSDHQLSVHHKTKRIHDAFTGRIERQQARELEEFKQKSIAPLPARWQRYALNEWENRKRKSGEVAANRWLLGVGEKAEACRIPPDATDAEICDLAKQKANEGSRLLETFKGRMARPRLARLCRNNGVLPPPESFDDGQAIVRMTDEMWWRRRLRQLHNFQSENLARELGFVHTKAGKYCSDETLGRRQQQNKRNLNTMQAINLVAVEDGEIMNLADIADTSLANKSLRKAELMTRINGIEKIAIEEGHVGLFLTMTTPSRMHIRLCEGGMPNPAYKGTTAKESHLYLQNLWEKIRANLGRQGILFYGLRVCEPHHDGTAHWHMLMFVKLDDQQQVISIMRDYALADSPEEAGASQYRFEVEEIRRELGSAAAYLIKYVSKNIDGQGMGDTLDGIPSIQSADRVEAWARSNSIRQFQTFGLPSISVWREFRRIPEEAITYAPDIVRVAHAAAQKTEDRQADYAEFVRMCGGVGLKRGDYNLQLAKEEKQFQGRYGLTTTCRPVGIYVTHSPDQIYKSNRRVWTPFNSTRAASFSPPWTCVNNCTHQVNQKVIGGFPHWWSELIEWESTAKDADGFEIGFFGNIPRKGREKWQ